MAIFLTSTGLSCEIANEELKAIFLNREKPPVAIVTTAAEDKENNKYSILAKNQFKGLGFSDIDFIDLEFQSEKSFSRYGVIYVCGGNTFKLLKFAREANFRKSIEELLKRGGIYIGVSAGSLILGPSIEIAGKIAADDNIVNLKDLSGLEIIDLTVLPHYSSELEEDVRLFEKEHNLKVERISNSQVIIIK